MTTATSPHRISAIQIDQARQMPDPRLAVLPEPRLAVLIGGNSSGYQFTDADCERLLAGLESQLAKGASLMITLSRRSPPALAAHLAARMQQHQGRVFIWDGKTSNPYTAILALADGVIVTADSVNMISEAAATGKPLHIFTPSGSMPKVERFIANLSKKVIVRNTIDVLAEGTYPPLNSTPEIARELLRRYDIFRQSTPSPSGAKE